MDGSGIAAENDHPLLPCFMFGSLSERLGHFEANHADPSLGDVVDSRDGSVFVGKLLDATSIPWSSMLMTHKGCGSCFFSTPRTDSSSIV